MNKEKYVRKSLEVEAVLLTENNVKEVIRWIEDSGRFKVSSYGIYEVDMPYIEFRNFDKVVKAYIGKHYVVKDVVDEEFYSVRKEEFEDMYVKLPVEVNDESDLYFKFNYLVNKYKYCPKVDLYTLVFVITSEVLVEIIKCSYEDTIANVLLPILSKHGVSINPSLFEEFDVKDKIIAQQMTDAREIASKIKSEILKRTDFQELIESFCINYLTNK